MPNKELVDYIKKLHKKGIHSDKIKAVLLNAGHDLKRVEEAILHVHYRNNITKIMIVIAIFVLLVALILIEATKPSKVVEEVIEPETEDLSSATTTVPSAATTIPEQEYEDDFDVGIIINDIAEAAVYLGDTTICDNIDKADVREKCKELVGKTTIPEQEYEDDFDVDIILNEIVEAVVRLGDTTICDNIDKADEREKCKELVGKE